MTVNSLSDMPVFACLTAVQSVRFIFALFTCGENHTYAARCYFLDSQLFGFSDFE